MAAKARCRCGTVLRIRCGRAGYKMRCPVCHSLVRVQRPKRKRQRPEPIAVAKPTPVPGNTLLAMAYEELAETRQDTPRRPVVDMVPVAPPESPQPAEEEVPIWQRWPIWVASGIAVALVVGVLVLVSR